MPFDGTLEGFALTDIVQIICVGKLTGIASVSSENQTMKLVFKEGRVVHANALPNQRLGARLVEGGYITQEQLNEALILQKECRRHVPLASLLVENGTVDKDLLEAETIRHIRDVFDSILAWDHGRCTFKPNGVPDRLTVLEDGLGTEELLLGSIISRDDKDQSEGYEELYDEETEEELLAFIP